MGTAAMSGRSRRGEEEFMRAQNLASGSDDGRVGVDADAEPELGVTGRLPMRTEGEGGSGHNLKKGMRLEAGGCLRGRGRIGCGCCVPYYHNDNCMFGNSDSSPPPCSGFEVTDCQAIDDEVKIVAECRLAYLLCTVRIFFGP